MFIALFTLFSHIIPYRCLYCATFTFFCCFIPYWSSYITLFTNMFYIIPNRFGGITLYMCTTIWCFIIYLVNLTLFNTFLLLKWVIFIFCTFLRNGRAFNLDNIPFLSKWTIFLHTFTSSIIKYWIFKRTLLTNLLCLIPWRSFLRT